MRLYPIGVDNAACKTYPLANTIFHRLTISAEHLRAHNSLNDDVLVLLPLHRHNLGLLGWLTTEIADTMKR